MSSTSLLDQIVRTRRFTCGVPGQFTITANCSTVLFLRSRAGDDPVQCLWAMDLDTGAERLLLDPARAAGALGAGVTAYATDAATRLVTCTISGELWAADVASGAARRLPTAGPAAEPRPDPAGERVAYVGAGGLRVITADGARDRMIMASDGPDVTVGFAREAGQVALLAGRGYWWAPDGTRLLVARVDCAPVELWHVSDPAEPGARPRAVRYPPAGTANADVSLWIAGLDGSLVQARRDSGAFEYVVGAGWDSRGPYAVVQSRDQRTVRFLEIDPASGETTIAAEQRDECWVQLVPGLPVRTASGALVAHRDLNGTRHLTVAGVTVTPPGLQVRAVLSVDGDELLFTASQEPTQIHLWSYRAGQGTEQLSAEPGVHTGVRRGRTLVHVARRAAEFGEQATVLRDGKPAVPIASLAAQPVLDVHAVPLALGPSKLRAMLYLPSWHRPGSGTLPVLALPYGGASGQRVTAELDWRCLLAQWFAEQGFAVLVADGRGTPGRGPEWERAVHGDLFGPVIDDQVTALHEAARRRTDLDLSRVGIRGWSFGGSVAAMAVLRRPDMFHAAVAGAGVTDQRLYNTHWRERFLGHPAEFPQRYEESSLVLAAPQLRRPLLLVHGLADDNVFPASTLRMSKALLAAGRPHEVLLLPGAGHADMGSRVSADGLQHQARFLQRHLGVDPSRLPA